MIADAGGHRHRGLGAARQLLHGVEDLDVAGAAAQVPTEVARRLLAGERRPVLVQQSLGAQHDPGRAEAALQRPRAREGARVPLPLLAGQSLERDHLRAVSPVEADLAGHHRLPVEQDQAASALPRGGAAVLRARDVELLAQRGQEVRVLADRDGTTVHHERRRAGRRRGPTSGFDVGRGGHATSVPRAPARVNKPLKTSC